MIALHLLNIAWQSLILSALAWLALRLCVRDARRRAWASALGIGVAVLGPLAMLIMPSEFALAGKLDRAAADISRMAASAAETSPTWKPNWTVKVQPIPARSVPGQPAITRPAAWSWRDLVLPAERVWMGGAFLFVLWIGVRTLRAWLWRRRLRPGPRSRVCCFEGKGSPCVVGILHPMIAVSRQHDFNEEQWRWLLAHEGEHVRGSDTALAWLFDWARAWLWWNPFIHALAGEWSQAREEVCDAAAVASNIEGERYANFLIDIASAHQTSGALAMAASSPARRLKARLLALLEDRRVCERVGPGFLVLAICSIAGAVVMVSCSGVRPEEPPTPKTKHIYTLWVEPKDFRERVAEVQRQGYTLVKPASADALDTADVATLKNAQGEITEVRKDAYGYEIVTRIYKVAPDFLARAGTGKTAQQILEGRGVAFPKGTSAAYQPATSQMTVTHTRAMQRRIEQAINEASVTLPMVYLQTKIIDGPELIGQADKLYDDAEYQKLLHDAEQKKGFSLMSAPSITSKLAQPATVEVVREVFGPPPSHPMKFVGVRVALKPISGPDGTLKLTGTLEVGRDITSKNDNDSAFVSRDGISSYENVKQWQKSFAAKLKHGQTVAVHLGETRPGRYVSAFMTARAINGKGESVTRFDENSTGPVKGVEVQTSTSTAAETDQRKDVLKAEKQIYLNAKVVTTPGDNSDFWADFMAGGASKTETEKSPEVAIEKPILPKSMPGNMPSDAFTLSGVLTDPQFQVVIRALNQKKGVSILSMPAATVRNWGNAILKSGDQECSVEASMGPDGYTIDLAVSYSDKKIDAGQHPQKVTTSVTLWDGQTLVLAGQSKLVFVTAHLIGPIGTAAKRDEVKQRWGHY